MASSIVVPACGSAPADMPIVGATSSHWRCHALSASRAALSLVRAFSRRASRSLRRSSRFAAWSRARSAASSISIAVSCRISTENFSEAGGLPAAISAAERSLRARSTLARSAPASTTSDSTRPAISRMSRSPSSQARISEAVPGFTSISAQSVCHSASTFPSSTRAFARSASYRAISAAIPDRFCWSAAIAPTISPVETRRSACASAEQTASSYAVAIASAVSAPTASVLSFARPPAQAARIRSQKLSRLLRRALSWSTVGKSRPADLAAISASVLSRLSVEVATADSRCSILPCAARSFSSNVLRVCSRGAGRTRSVSAEWVHCGSALAASLSCLDLT